jgi:hypothetical protein
MLQPFMELASHKRSTLGELDWLNFVDNLKTRIVENPHQFLGAQLPQQEIIRQSIEEIFQEYLLDQRESSEFTADSIAI